MTKIAWSEFYRKYNFTVTGTNRHWRVTIADTIILPGEYGSIDSAVNGAQTYIDGVLARTLPDVVMVPVEDLRIVLAVLSECAIPLVSGAMLRFREAEARLHRAMEEKYG